MTAMFERRTNVTPIRPGLLTPQASPRLLTARDRVWVGPANPSLESLLLRKIVLIHRRNLRSFAVGRGFALCGSAISTLSRFFLMMSSYSSALSLSRDDVAPKSEPSCLGFRLLGMEILAGGSRSRIASSTSKSTIVAEPAFRNKLGFAAASS
jgi:hypothetical protein